MIEVGSANYSEGSSFFTFGVPLVKGSYWPEQHLVLVDEDNNRLNANIQATSLWSNKSIRWCLIKAAIPQGLALPSIKNNDKKKQYKKLFLTTSSPTAVRKIDCAVKTANSVTLHSKGVALNVNNSKPLSLQVEAVTPETLASFSNSFTSSLQLAIGGFRYTIQEESAKSSTKNGSDGTPICASLDQQFHVQLQDSDKHLKLLLNYQFDYQSSALELTMSLHNPMPLIPNGGQWDLGNENSVELEAFGINIELPNAPSSIYCEDEATVLEGNSSETSPLTCRAKNEGESWQLQIRNSGGENWQSKNHLNKYAKVELGARGSTLTQTQLKDGELIESSHPILRPSVLCTLAESTNLTCAVALNESWQKFPIEVSGDRGNLSIDFAPIPERTDENEPNLVELQPGEIKSHTLRFVFETKAQSDDAPTQTSTAFQATPFTPNQALFCDANTVAWLNEDIVNSSLNNIVDMGLTGERNYFNKREALDEFGWRNFGDIYADHEAVGHEGDDIFVSHYNNQYDPLYGFLKQWLLTGQEEWKKLADDLFDHIINIDIYHTSADKQEYNGGLFWHTDHYVEAETATHRTYSKRQKTGVYEDHAGGGGPGSHHCYTNGLALYYQLSGHPKAKEAVLKLAHWIGCFFEGDGTVLGTLLQYRNKIIVRNPLTGQYPLDRGVANYINALIDSYELTGDRRYIERVSTIILHTFSSEDDIQQRNFADIENTWYYIVFMQAVAKYMWLCETTYGINHDYEPVRKAFLHYLDYIANTELPYLHNSDSLEYPNDTWTAQDLRKIMVLKVGLKYADSDSRREQISAKIASLSEFVEAKLHESEEKAFTRILALIMQNNVAIPNRVASGLANTDSNTDSNSWDTKAPIRTVAYKSQTFSLGRYAWQFLKQYSIKREFKHLFIRFPQLSLRKKSKSNNEVSS